MQRLRRELHRAIDASEELQLRLMVRKMAPGDKPGTAQDADGGASGGGAGSAKAGEADDDATDPAVIQLKIYQQRRARLTTALSRHYSSKFAMLAEQQKTQAQQRSCADRFLASNLVKVFKRSLNGLVTVVRRVSH